MRLLAIAVFTFVAISVSAGTVEVQVRDTTGAPVRDAVIYAVPNEKKLPLAKKSAVMDQKDRAFIPHVLPIQTGTAVQFPNSDDVRHHVYSFSPAKPFQIALYKGTPANPIVFDVPGVVSLGCNIHDRMTAYIVVVDTPYFDKSDNEGRVRLEGLDSGDYAVQLWYPDMRETPQVQKIKVTATGREVLSFVARGRSGSK